MSALLRRAAYRLRQAKIFHARSYSQTPWVPNAKYGGRDTVTMLPGSGVGPELMGYVKEVFRFVGAPVDFEEVTIDISEESNEQVMYAITSIRRNGVAIKGNVETKSMNPSVWSRDLALRTELDLYVYVIHCKSFPGVPSRHDNIDVVVIRQNTEGEYSTLEHEAVPGVIESLKIITEKNTDRFARYAFEYARKHGRKKVSVVHKANIMKLSDGTFLKTAEKVAKEYPDIQQDNIIIDNCCMQLVKNPNEFDVLLSTNLYGSIVANILCGMIGGPGLVSGKNYGRQYAMFEPGSRYTGTAIAGLDIANPICMLNASVDLLRHLGHSYHAEVISQAVEKTVNQDRVHTSDIQGTATTSDVVLNIIKHTRAYMREKSPGGNRTDHGSN